MKKILVAAVTLMVMLAFSCKKDNPVHQPFIGANINGSPSVGQPSSNNTVNGDSLVIRGQFGVKNITMTIRFAGAGKYTLGRNQASLFNEPSAAVQTPYLLDTTKINTVTISEYNPAINVAAGSFELHFVEAPGNTVADFTNGQFWMSLLPR